jgi:serine protease Do
MRAYLLEGTALKHLLTRLVTTLAFVFSAAEAQSLPKETRTRIMQSVVEVLALANDSGAPRLGEQGGSGTIISTSGYLLTNYHVIFNDDTNKEIKRHAIRFTENPSKEPVIKAIATIAMTLPKLDLALLKITEDEKGNPIAADRNFVASPVGNPFDMVLGEQLTIAGYPGIGGRTITFTNGVFSGWTGENYRSSGTNWIKTDGKISSGNSGGGAFDEQGNLVGVPTGGITRRISQTLTEFQNYLRPIHLAFSLFDAKVPDTVWAGGRRPSLPADIDASGLVVPVVAGGLLPAKTGQSWQMTIEGLPTWTINLTRLDQDGDPTGAASQVGTSQPFIAYAYEDDGLFYFHVESQRNEAFACTFEDPIIAKDNTLSEGIALNSPPNADDWKALNKSCTVTLQGSTTIAPPVSNDPPKVGGELIASFPPKPGQTWTVTVQGLEPWTVEFKNLDNDGDPEGISRQGSFSGVAYAFTDDESSKTFQFAGANGMYWCVFPRNPNFEGANMVGGKTFFRASSQQSAGNLNKNCTATLTSLGSSTIMVGKLEPKELLKLIRI